MANNCVFDDNFWSINPVSVVTVPFSFLLLLLPSPNWAIYKVWLFVVVFIFKSFWILMYYLYYFSHSPNSLFSVFVLWVVLSFGRLCHMTDDALENGVVAAGSQIGAGAESQVMMAFRTGRGKEGQGLHRHSRALGRVRWEDVGEGEGLQSNQRCPLGGQHPGALGQRRFLDLGECCSKSVRCCFWGTSPAFWWEGFAKVFLGSDSAGSLFQNPTYE